MTGSKQDRAKALFLAGALVPGDAWAIPPAPAPPLPYGPDYWAAPDAPDEWVLIDRVGGTVCGVCGTPVESEPCEAHQPAAYQRARSGA